MIIRPRRLRVTAAMRNFVRETRVSPSMLVYPLFVREGNGIVEEIESLPGGQYRYSPDTLPRVLEKVAAAGISAVLLFGIPAKKDELGSSAWAEDGVVQQALIEGKRRFPELIYITDVCLCEYTSHGHCGAIRDGYVDNDALCPYSPKQLCPMSKPEPTLWLRRNDGWRVGAIRAELEQQGFF